jgi:octaprenyl-diphosphate synthase
MNQSSTLDDLYREIAPDLARVEVEIAASLADDEPVIAEMTNHASRFGGKRLRPALSLLVARAAGGITPRHARLGAVVEMIHLATLVHDDVIDGAGLRRNQPTVNAAWGNYEAVLLGDVIFARAINLLARLKDERALLSLTTAVSRLCSGEILQNRHRRDVALSEDLYYQIIESKTAELYAAGCELAAHLAGAPDLVLRNLSTYGRELGIAFQIVDDCLDLVGDEKIAGKSLGTDLEYGKMTLPLILFRNTSGPRERRLLESVISGGCAPAEEVRRLVSLLSRDGAVDGALARAREHVERASVAARRVLPESAWAPLEALGEFVIRRRI